MSLSPELKEQIQSIVGSGPIVVFMKGNASAPQCGFSARVVDILNRVVPDYVTFDVLSDPEIREGIKEFSEWPTIPQLYIHGEFQGGCDIVGEMYSNGELHTALGLPSPEVGEVTLSLSDEVAEILRQELSRYPDGTQLHLQIDAAFRHGVGFGPAQGGEIAVEVGGLTVLLDRDSAARANGLGIGLEEGERVRFTFDNPNAPAGSS